MSYRKMIFHLKSYEQLVSLLQKANIINYETFTLLSVSQELKHLCNDFPYISLPFQSLPFQLFYSHAARGFGLGAGTSTGGGSEALMKV